MAEFSIEGWKHYIFLITRCFTVSNYSCQYIFPFSAHLEQNIASNDYKFNITSRFSGMLTTFCLCACFLDKCFHCISSLNVLSLLICLSSWIMLVAFTFEHQIWLPFTPILIMFSTRYLETINSTSYSSFEPQPTNLKCFQKLANFFLGTLHRLVNLQIKSVPIVPFI